MKSNTHVNVLVGTHWLKFSSNKTMFVFVIFLSAKCVLNWFIFSKNSMPVPLLVSCIFSKILLPDPPDNVTKL